MSAHISEVLDALGKKPVAAAETLRQAREIYIRAVTQEGEIPGGVMAVMEAADVLGVGREELEFDVSATKGLRDSEKDLMAGEEEMARIDKRIGEIEMELGTLPWGDPAIAPLRAERAAAMDRKIGIEHHAGCIEIGMRDLAFRCPRVFGSNFRMLARSVRESRRRPSDVI